MVALRTVQEELRYAEQQMKGDCAFAGASTHLHQKGSMSLQATKPGHDDRNGPACSTLWQNLTACESGARLQLVVVVNGCDVIIDAPVGHAVMFQAWLPHLTRIDAEGPACSTHDWRLHHTAYTRFGTEYFAWVVQQYRRTGVALESGMRRCV